MAFRLLGKCPSCKTNDEIHRQEDYQNFSEVKCGKCNTSWENWIKLEEEQKSQGNRMIPVGVERWGSRGVELCLPQKNEVPFTGLIKTVLNSALMSKYNLSACFATEGGVEKMGNRPYSLLNHENIGLSVEFGERNARYTLNFYEKMLRNLFEEPLSFGGYNFRRGAILWLEESQKFESDAMLYLFASIAKTGGKKFALGTIEKMNQVSKNPFSEMYTRGMTNEEIVKYFVPPPIQNQQI